MNQSEQEVLKNLRPNEYLVNITLPGTPGEKASATFVVNRSDFAVWRISHCVVGDDGTDEQQYLLDWSEQNEVRYYKGATPPHSLLFGSVRHGIWKEYDPPIKLELNTTVFVELTNAYPGTGSERQIQVLFTGAETRRENKG